MEQTPQTTLTKDPRSREALTVRRLFTQAGVHPFETVEWETRTAAVGSFRQDGVEFPSTWSQNATNIVAQKYFRGQLDSPTRERSVKQMVGRVSGTIADWGRERGYFASVEDGDAFEAELTYILLHQLAAFNSPVWFNVGFEEQPQCSACFILSVEDNMESILDWNTKEGRIFRGGSGSGINLSRIRGSMEPLAKGGTASGPVSFMRGADSWAGTIKSGGKTRRAAKMVVLDVDHPDIRDFIWCKAREEDKAAALRDAGFDMSIDGDGFHSIQYQNANNSVRVTDEFMHAVENDEDWQLTTRTTGEPTETVSARELMREISEAAWRCADPGVQYDTTINQWHTSPNSGRINASNPCSEYMHVDDSACNLASLNLMKFRRPDGTFDTERFKHAVDVVFLAQEIIVGPSSYPTEQIGRNARAFRQLGLGYANLGAFLMANGFAYDSDEGRGAAAAITALMTGRAYAQSAKIAAAIGPYDRYAENREAHNNVMRMHRDASYAVPDRAVGDEALLAAARETWNEAVELGERYGYRNAQATVLAPTGTISFLMDCDTTGIEPDFSLVKYKELVGGGTMTIANRTVPMALRTLGYNESQVEQIEAYVAEHGTIVGAPELSEEHLPVFDVAVGSRAISHAGHIKMMGAAQPFLSGAISKTVNLPQTATVEDIAEAYIQAWKLGVKALAIYRDGSKTAQALRTDAQVEAAVAAGEEVFTARPGRGADRGCRGQGTQHRRQGRGPGAQAHAARAQVAHAQVLARRPRGLHHGRHVRRRHGRRDLPDRHRQGGLDAPRHDELVRHRDLDRAPVRGAARDAGEQVRLHALRAGGDHHQPGDPVRQVDARLHHALARLAVPRRRPPGGARHPHPRGPRAQDGRGHRDRRHRRLLGADQRRHQGPGGDGAPGPDLRADRLAPGRPRPHGRARPRAGVQPVRRHDAAHGLVLHVLELRQQHRLRLDKASVAWGPAFAGPQRIGGSRQRTLSASPARRSRQWTLVSRSARQVPESCSAVVSRHQRTPAAAFSLRTSRSAPSSARSHTNRVSISACESRSPAASTTACARLAACGGRRPAITFACPNIPPAASTPHSPASNPRPSSTTKCARSCGSSRAAPPTLCSRRRRARSRARRDGGVRTGSGGAPA